MSQPTSRSTNAGGRTLSACLQPTSGRRPSSGTTSTRVATTRVTLTTAVSSSMYVDRPPSTTRSPAGGKESPVDLSPREGDLHAYSWVQTFPGRLRAGQRLLVSHMEVRILPRERKIQVRVRGCRHAGGKRHRR